MIAIKHRKQIDLNLRLHEILNLSHLHSGMAIECEQGALWVTSTGDIHDYTLVAGERYVAQTSTPLVIEAVQDAVINLKDTEQEVSIQIT
jgi:hypothetical protein